MFTFDKYNYFFLMHHYKRSRRASKCTPIDLFLSPFYCPISLNKFAARNERRLRVHTLLRLQWVDCVSVRDEFEIVMKDVLRDNM